jgi:hypothetical protein
MKNNPSKLEKTADAFLTSDFGLVAINIGTVIGVGAAAVVTDIITNYEGSLYRAYQTTMENLDKVPFHAFFS